MCAYKDYLKQKKELHREIARKHVVDGKSFQELSRKYKLSTTTIWKAIKRYKSEYE